jgi:hypothetical protein
MRSIEYRSMVRGITPAWLARIAAKVESTAMRRSHRTGEVTSSCKSGGFGWTSSHSPSRIGVVRGNAREPAHDAPDRRHLDAQKLVAFAVLAGAGPEEPQHVCRLDGIGQGL